MNLSNISVLYSFFEKAIANGTKDNVRYAWIATCYENLEQYNEAIAYYEKAINEGWNENMRYFKIGACYLGLKQHQQAINYFEKALKDGVSSEWCYEFIAHCYRDMEQYQQAIKYYEKTLKENANYDIALDNIGYSYEKLKRYKEAMPYYKKASELGSSYSSIRIALLYTYGYGVTRDYNNALEYISKAEKQASDEEEKASYLDAHGEVLLKFGKYDEAKQVWIELQNKYPTEIEQLAERKGEVFITAMKQGTNPIDIDIPETNIKNENTFALIFANENYKRIAPVPYANNDGKVFALYCQKTLGVPEKNIHLVCDATLGDMKYNIGLMKQIAEAYDGDARFIIYYAGHGIPAENQEQTFLLPIDGYGADGTGYPLNDLYNELGSMNTKSVILLLDACFSGSQRDGNMLASARGVAIKAKTATPAGNMVVLTAAQGDETAYPDNENGHGLFTYYLLKKLQDTKGNCTLGEISDYIISNVKRRSIVVNKKLQTPSISVASSLESNWRTLKLK